MNSQVDEMLNQLRATVRIHSRSSKHSSRPYMTTNGCLRSRNPRWQKTSGWYHSTLFPQTAWGACDRGSCTRERDKASKDSSSKSCSKRVDEDLAWVQVSRVEEIVSDLRQRIETEPDCANRLIAQEWPHIGWAALSVSHLKQDQGPMNLHLCTPRQPLRVTDCDWVNPHGRLAIVAPTLAVVAFVYANLDAVAPL